MQVGRIMLSKTKAILTLETLQIFIFDFREAAGIRQLQETLRIRSLLFWPGPHRRKPLEEVDRNVVEGHGRKASEPGPTSQHILAQYGVAPLHLPASI